MTDQASLLVPRRKRHRLRIVVAVLVLVPAVNGGKEGYGPGTDITFTVER